ncbi:phosphoglycerate mutase-like protein [Parathielavia hyrcaniae]|uniref:Phosphoglycerate mutase-like protein n=1 Tax=Parathielavia hyrcaniae TaxID=113614 RepID=A0AAN6QG40_9PEZI|nr:phosphoglycerate mutase-like protein [Parathielavia hyrcaniae]
MLQVIYVTRHGFRSNWLVDPSSGTYTAFIKSPTGGAADPALTAHGVDQANELAVRLLAADPPIERVYSSLYYRCLQTVEPFVRQAQEATAGDKPALRIRGETGLGEWYGSADFEHPVPASLEKLDSLFPGLLDLSYEPAVTPNRMGESIDALHDRVAAALEVLIAQCDRDGVRAILLCSHAAVIIALGRVLTGHRPTAVETPDFKCFTCGLSLYRRRQSSEVEAGGNNSRAKQTAAEHDANVQGQDSLASEFRGDRGLPGGWDCELNSDCAHLSLGEERGWAFSGDESFKDMAAGQSMLNTTTTGLGVAVDDKSRFSGRHAEDGRGKL